VTKFKLLKKCAIYQATELTRFLVYPEISSYLEDISSLLY